MKVIQIPIDSCATFSHENKEKYYFLRKKNTWHLWFDFQLLHLFSYFFENDVDLLKLFKKLGKTVKKDAFLMENMRKTLAVKDCL